MSRFVLPVGLLLAALCPLAVQAQPSSVLARAHAGASPNIVEVYGGCGPYGHRGPYGGCRPGGQFGRVYHHRFCPPGFHLGRFGRRCFPN